MTETPRCEVIPLPSSQTSFHIDGREVTRWHFGPQATRPFFYPLVGPESGSSLTRIGHPGAPDHDHHRSVWFAHAKLLGMDFWSDQGDTFIRQQQWLAYEEGDEQTAMAVKLGWFDGHNPQPLLDHENDRRCAACRSRGVHSRLALHVCPESGPVGVPTDELRPPGRPCGEVAVSPLWRGTSHRSRRHNG